MTKIGAGSGRSRACAVGVALVCTVLPATGWNLSDRAGLGPSGLRAAELTDQAVEGAPQTASRRDVQESPPPVPPDRPAIERATLRLQRGESLMGALRRAGLGRSEAYLAAQKVNRVADTRTLAPGRAIHLRFAGKPGNPALERLRLQTSATTNAVVNRTADGSFSVATKDRALRTQTYGVAGKIRRSLFAAGRRHDVPPQLMFTMIRKFSYQVDFQRDLKKGDAFELLYRTKTDAHGRRAVTGPLLYAAVERDGERLEMYRFDAEGPDAYYTPAGKSVRRLLMRTPLNGARISSGYGMREHPISGYSRMHEGVDFAAPGGTPVYAAGSGVVDFAGRNGGYGKYLELNHRDPYQTAYAHLRRFADGIRPGVRVQQGDVVGYVGSTGRSTGPHLHYEILKGSQPVNPSNLDLPTGHTLSGKALDRFEKRMAKIDRWRARHTGTVRVAKADCENDESGC